MSNEELRILETATRAVKKGSESIEQRPRTRHQDLVSFLWRHYIKVTQHEKHLIFGSNTTSYRAGIATTAITAHAVIGATGEPRGSATSTICIAHAFGSNGGRVSLQQIRELVAIVVGNAELKRALVDILPVVLKRWIIINLQRIIINTAHIIRLRLIGFAVIAYLTVSILRR